MALYLPWCRYFFAQDPGPGPPCHLAVEVFNVGGWLTHGDLALDARIDFLAVVEHRLIPAWVRSEWAGLRSKGVASIWALGVVSLRGAPLSSSRGSLIAVGWSGALCLWVLVGLCIWLFCMVIKGLILTLNSLR